MCIVTSTNAGWEGERRGSGELDVKLMTRRHDIGLPQGLPVRRLWNQVLADDGCSLPSSEVS